jgi:hypothetical protein
VDQVVRGRLVGDHVGPHAAPDQLGQDLAALPTEPIERALPSRSARGSRERVVEVARLLVEVRVDSRIAMRDGWHSIASIDAPAIVAASGCAPPMPPSPACRTQRPRRSRRSAGGPPRRNVS